MIPTGFVKNLNWNKREKNRGQELDVNNQGILILSTREQELSHSMMIFKLVIFEKLSHKNFNILYFRDYFREREKEKL